MSEATPISPFLLKVHKLNNSIIRSRWVAGIEVHTIGTPGGKKYDVYESPKFKEDEKNNGT